LNPATAEELEELEDVLDEVVELVGEVLEGV
jgi:hypothetical protein